jgi:hypothetical protein
LQIWQKATTGAVVRMADIIARHHGFSTDLTAFCHNKSSIDGKASCLALEFEGWV